MAMGWKDWYKAAKKNVRPTYRQIRKMDSDDWLAAIGLEKRNVTADVLGALGLVTVGCGIGFALGLLFAPKKGEELRRDFNQRLRGQARVTASETAPAPSGYAS